MLVYLRAPMAPAPLVALLLLLALFWLAAKAYTGVAFLGIVALAVAAFLRAPRWSCYALLAATLLVVTTISVFQVSTGGQDPRSTRDDAVEIAAHSLLAGDNPWTAAKISVPITTGPASILLALPWVALFGRVNELTFVFYVLFFAFLLAGDLRYRNGTFLPLGLFICLGEFGFEHTRYWSLEELYWPYAALGLAWVLVGRGALVAAGACLGFAVCARVSYAFPVFGFLCWYTRGGRGSVSGLVRLGIGAVAGTAVVLAPFVIVAGWTLLTANPLAWAIFLSAGSWPDTNLVFRLLNRAADVAGPVLFSRLKSLLALALMWLGAERLRRADLLHPFWHLALGGFVADLLVYRVDVLNDYVLFFVVPAFMAIAHSPSPLLGTTAPAVRS